MRGFWPFWGYITHFLSHLHSSCSHHCCPNSKPTSLATFLDLGRSGFVSKLNQCFWVGDNFLVFRHGLCDLEAGGVGDPGSRSFQRLSRQCCCGGSGRSRGSGVVDLEKKKKKRIDSGVSENELGESERVSSNGGGGESLSFRLGNLQKYVEGEQVAAGWPAWFSAVAGEAIHGWVPLSADSFEKLEKVGQGTYSSVFHARNLETGRIVALKKVRFDNFEPESVRFMAREIMILRRLDHPNIIKLEGLITSRLSCSIYLVFEYMEHDISGLLSSPDINIPEDARSNAWVSFDGKRRQQLSRGDSVRISMSQHPLPTVNKSDQTSDWFHSLIQCLNWNERLDQKAL
ncbi:unnamed protein product [Camellia sinensis]